MYTTLQQQSVEDLKFLNKKYNRWRLGPSMPARYLGYALILYAVYALFMVYLQTELFRNGMYVYMDLFVIRLVTGVLALLVSFGKFNFLILKCRIKFFPGQIGLIRRIEFGKESFTVFEGSQKQLYYYSDVVQWDIFKPQVTFQTKYRCFIVRPEYLEKGTWPEFMAYMKTRKEFGEKEALRRRRVF